MDIFSYRVVDPIGICNFISKYSVFKKISPLTQNDCKQTL